MFSRGLRNPIFEKKIGFLSGKTMFKKSLKKNRISKRQNDV